MRSGGDTDNAAAGAARVAAGAEPAAGVVGAAGAVDVAAVAVGGSGGDEPDDVGRRLFRYVTGDEWRDYRAIMGVFAGTFFSEFTPEEVTERLRAAGGDFDAAVVADRLESLRRWGNLTVSSAVGNPTSITDYYRRRNRYLITQAGQEVHELVEGVLGRVDEVRDVSTGRLRALLDALKRLGAAPVATMDPVELADLVQAVFDPYQAFTREITQFFAAINQWQSRYDLSPEEFSFFVEVLVSYVAERLDEIERTARPVGQALRAVTGQIPVIVERANRGLASRVDEAGLTDITVRRPPGSTVEDWEHLHHWFHGSRGRHSRIDQLGREAVAAIHTLTINLTRLSRVGIGAASRRADFLRLARYLHDADPDDLPVLTAAAFGLHPTNHWGVAAADADDPVSSTTPWREAPQAAVPVSLRERGETTNRGRASPIRDREAERRSLLRRRDLERAERRRVDEELLSLREVDGHQLSPRAFHRLEELVGTAVTRLGVAGTRYRHTDGAVTCIVERHPGTDTTVSSPEGTLVLRNLHIMLAALEAQDADGR